MKKRICTLALASVVVISLLSGCSSEESSYKKGVTAQENENYEEAVDYFTQAGDYEDSKDRLAKCQHLLDVGSDATAPEISGLEETINVTCGTTYNLNDYISENITITDDVTAEITDYSISGDDVYDRGTGNIDTTESGEHDITITAKDEAGNEGTATCTLSINPVVVSADDPNPVIYDGEYATITLKSFKHGEIYEYSDMYGYSAEFNVENKCDEPIEVYWSMYTAVNGYQVNPSYEVSSIAPGNKGTMLSYFLDEDIPEEAGNFSQIDSIVCIKKENDDSSFFRIPTTFYTDAVE